MADKKDKLNKSIKKIEAIYDKEAKRAFRKYNLTSPIPKLVIVPREALHCDFPYPKWMMPAPAEAHLNTNEIWISDEIFRWNFRAAEIFRHELSHIIAYKKSLKHDNKDKDLRKINKDLDSGIRGDLIAHLGGRRLRRLKS